MNGFLAETKYTIKNILHNHWADFGLPFFRFSFARTTTKVNVVAFSKGAQNDLAADFQGFIRFTNIKSEISLASIIHLELKTTPAISAIQCNHSLPVIGFFVILQCYWEE